MTSDGSSKLFDTSKPQPPDDGDRRPVILLDQTFSSAKVAEFLRAFADWRVALHGQHFASNCPDQVWIPECAKRGWLILSCDKAIRRSPLLCAVVRESKAKVFFTGRGGRRGEDYAAALYTARHRILRIARNNAGPFFARIHQTGAVELVGHDTAKDSKAHRTRRKFESGAAYRQFEAKQRSKGRRGKK